MAASAFVEETRKRLEKMKSDDHLHESEHFVRHNSAPVSVKPEVASSSVAQPQPPNPPAPTRSLAGFVWSFFGGGAGTEQGPDASTGTDASPNSVTTNQSPDLPALKDLAQQAVESSNLADSKETSELIPVTAGTSEGLIPLKETRRSSILESALSFIGSFVDPGYSEGEDGERSPRGEHAAENLGDPNAWPTSFAPLPPDEQIEETGTSPKPDTTSLTGTSPPNTAAVSTEPHALSPEEEEALRLEEEMNSYMNESDLADWELAEQAHLKRKERERTDYYAEKFTAPTAKKPTSVTLTDGMADPATSKKELTQLLLDTLPPLLLLDRESDTVPVLSLSLAEAIRTQLPHMHRESRRWSLLYSLEQHGISLSTLYRLSSAYNGPIILGIKNNLGELFGAFLTDSLIPRGGYYGTGECFLWKALNKAEPWEIKVFRATGKNEFMIHTENSFLSFGGGWVCL
jgi:hypothetical protein